MSITLEKAKDILKKHGIESEEQLKEELRKNILEIGMFTMPFPKSIEKEA